MDLGRANDDDFSERLAWFALGAMIGVTGAMLFAPARGQKTRERLANEMRSGGQNLYESGQGLVERGRELFEKGREIATEAAEMFERGKRMAEPAYTAQGPETEFEAVPGRGL